MRYLKVLGLLVFFFLALAIFAQNMEQLNQGLTMDFNLLGTTWFVFSTPFYIAALTAFLIGGILSMLFFLAERVRLSRQLKDCRSRLASLEQEVNSLRNLPLEEHSRPEPAQPSGLEEKEEE
jgi:putative membrane protein